MKKRIKKLINCIEARTVANICGIAATTATFAVMFTMAPLWHEEAEVPSSLMVKLR